MSFMGCFNDRITTANQQLMDLTTAAKVLQNSSEFHTILHILLTCGNLINGDFNAQLVEGFRPSRILDFCSLEFPSGLTLLDVLAERMHQKFSELKKVVAQCSILEKASKVDFSTFLNHLQYFENGQRLVEMELQVNNNEVLTNFLVHCELETAQYKEIIGLAKDQIISMLQFFGEQIQDVEDSNFRPEEFMGTIAEFSKELESSLSKYEATT
uniref:FH2 domain-containing protein n=1 Tax=Ditylenchus dipsaci TaxID=166011 RepID=A0A915DDI0_9BILA